MKNIITTLTQGAMASSTFFGHAVLSIGAKLVKFTVCKHLAEGVEYEFRAITKCKAGWNTICDFKCKAEHLWEHIGKHTQCVQVKVIFKSGGEPQWHHVYVAKGGKWQTVDVLLLDVCKIADVHNSAPKMACYETWKRTNATHWDCLAFVMNNNSNKKAA